MRILLVVLILAVTRSIGAQSAQGDLSRGSISGQIVADDDGRAVPASRVVLVGVTEARRSSPTASFRFDKLSPGRYTLRAQSVGFIQLDTLISLGMGDTRRVTVRLQRVPVTLSAITVREAIIRCPPGTAPASSLTGAPGGIGTKADPCVKLVPKKQPPQPQLTNVVRVNATFLGSNLRLLQDAQEAVTESGLVIERVLQVGDRNWVIFAHAASQMTDTATVRVDVVETGADDTTIHVSLRIEATPSAKRPDHGQMILSTIRRKHRS
ncbi:MAG: carboxypeptidase-like regulatory domain-containing protein [Gemmatimonadales bacterium]